MSLKNGNPDKKRSFLCTTGRRAHFLDRDRTSRGIFPKIYISSKKMATGRSLKNEIPARNAQHFLDRDRRSRGIFPKDEFKNGFRHHDDLP